MNVDKALLKMQLAQLWGKKIEGIEDTAKADVHRLEGSAASLKQAAAALEAHRAYYQTATDEGEIDGPTCSTAMGVITRCVGGLQNLADRAQLALSLKQGELQGIRRGLGILEQDYQAESARLEAISDMAEYSGRPDAAAQEIQRRKAEAADGRPSPEAIEGDHMPAAKKTTKKKAAKKTTKKKTAKKSTKKKRSKRSA